MPTNSIETYEKKIYDLEQLLGISRALNSTLDSQYLMQAVLDMCLAQMQTLQAGLYLRSNEDHSCFRIMNYSRDFEFPLSIHAYNILDDSVLFSHITERKETVSIRELQEKISNEKEVRMLSSMGVELIAPMQIRNNTIGMIFLGQKASMEPYPLAEWKFLMDLASLSAISVHNAALFERATTDKMTGLKNYACFQTHFRECWENSCRDGDFLGFLFTDLDKFKLLNDNYSHLFGDQVLAKTAHVLLEAVKKEAIAFRYGGEEFCIVLNQGNQESLLKMAEKIRKGVEDMEVEYEGKKVAVTVSVGATIFDLGIDSNDYQSLIRRADSALYLCKQNGRNQLQFLEPVKEESNLLLNHDDDPILEQEG